MKPSWLENISPELRLRALEEEAARRRLPLPHDVRTRLLREEAHRRGLLVYKSFHEFVGAMNPTLLRYEHVPKLVDVAERVISGLLRRVMFLIPTQAFKSEIVSRLLTAYWLLKFPTNRVALASYSSDLAWELSGEARDYYAAAGGRFKEGSPKGSTRNWRTAQAGSLRGGMWATGIEGVALGRGYNLGVVDDPISPEQVLSTAFQRRFARWWTASWLRGQRPGGSPIIVVMQRLDVADPVAWLLNREEAASAEKWHIVALDEIKSTEPFGRWKGPGGFPTTCTLEPDNRKEGEVLYPSYRSLEEAKRIQAQVGPVVAAAQRQQRPMRPTGDFWPLSAFQDRTYDRLPSDAYNGGWHWDTAFTANEENSATAGIYMFRGPGDKETCRIFIEDVDWDWLEFPELIKRMRSKSGPHFVEKKASGKSAVQVLKTHGVIATEVPVLGDKLSRASAVQPVALNGRIYVNALVYQKLLWGEHQGLLRVTAEALRQGGEGLDLNDAFVQGVWHLLDIASSRPKLKFK